MKERKANGLKVKILSVMVLTEGRERKIIVI